MKLIKFKKFINESKDSAIDWFKDLESDIEINYPEVKMTNKIKLNQDFILCKLTFTTLSNSNKDRLKNEVIRGLGLIEDKTDWGLGKVFYSFDGEHYVEKSQTSIDLNVDIKSLNNMEFLIRISECSINGLAFYLYPKIKVFK